MPNVELMVNSLRSTLGAVVGATGDVFAAPGRVFTAQLRIDDGADVPGGAVALTPGRTMAAVVKIAPTGAAVTPRSICVKLTDAYGPDRDQDFLLASSLDGVPWHHAVVHRDNAVGLYSSLWLYMAGWAPVVFGVRAHDAPGAMDRWSAGDRLDFLLAGAVSRFHRIGELELGEEGDGNGVVFDAAHCGGGLRALPPASSYTST